MNKFIGIDLGTTNSAIASYDGEATRIWKSHEQMDVTPSVIHVNKRGNKYIGQRAYAQLVRNPQQTIALFKRYMGTDTVLEIPSAGIRWTPEECAAQVLKEMLTYLPEEWHEEDEMNVVITVPAAFNQMQKDATADAARMAGIERVALMQEPVAAVMSVMKYDPVEGLFVIFDLGGGTLDVAIAQNIGGRVSLLAHGGLAMCGGRDFDRLIVDEMVMPWLDENFELPAEGMADPKYSRLQRMASYAAETAKIALSSAEETYINLEESDAATVDENGDEIYLNIGIDRERLNALIAPQVEEMIDAVRATLKRAGVAEEDIARMVFVGGPTCYKPLRDAITTALGMKSSVKVNPMTAVAEGAALFAESVNWEDASHERKGVRAKLTADELGVELNYKSRVSGAETLIGVSVTRALSDGMEWQVECMDSGWSSGKNRLVSGEMMSVPLEKQGENRFRVTVFDADGRTVALPHNEIIVTKTAAVIEAIPASHSIGVAVRDKIGSGGQEVLDFLVRQGDPLPQKGVRKYRAGQQIAAGSSEALHLMMYEGDITHPVSDNRLIGTLKFAGTDFDEGNIEVGDELICSYEVTDAGHVVISVAVPKVRGVVRGDKNFYSRQEGTQTAQEIAARVADSATALRKRVDAIGRRIDDKRLEAVRDKVYEADMLAGDDEDMERVKHAEEKILEAKRLLAETRRDNLTEIRQIEMQELRTTFDDIVARYGTEDDKQMYEQLVNVAELLAQTPTADGDFEQTVTDLRRIGFGILYRQDWYIKDLFQHVASTKQPVLDRERFDKLVARGKFLLEKERFSDLRNTVFALYSLLPSDETEDTETVINIIRG